MQSLREKSGLKRHILIVDDEMVNREMIMRFILQKMVNRRRIFCSEESISIRLYCLIFLCL